MANRVAEAITEYERNRANPKGAEGAEELEQEMLKGISTPGCLPLLSNYEGVTKDKTFLNCKSHAFSGTEGIVGLSRWFEKIESVFQISKCVDEDMVKYAVCSLEGRALTWWNGHVHTLGIDAANRIPWNELKNMMNDEYFPTTEIQKIEQELWNLPMKGYDIDGYTDHFYKLAVMCPIMVTPEYKKIERYIWGLPEKVQGNVTSSKLTTIHEAVTMARGLVDQAVQAKATRISDNNKRKWEEQ
ncbi:putative reverse transcriptase domain-containing protein [Tanacetum coccineum]